MSERRACRVVRQWRGTQRYLPLRRTDEDQLTQAILALAAKYGRYGYRRITALLQDAGWPVGKDRVQRIWRREGLKVPQKQRPRGRLWLGGWFVCALATGAGESCVELRFCEGDDARWTGATCPGGDRRVHAGVLSVAGGTALGEFAGDRHLGGCDVGARNPRAHTFGQWTGVYCRGVAKVAGQSGHEDVVHRAGESLGERVL